MSEETPDIIPGASISLPRGPRTGERNSPVNGSMAVTCDDIVDWPPVRRRDDHPDEELPELPPGQVYSSDEDDAYQTGEVGRSSWTKHINPTSTQSVAFGGGVTCTMIARAIAWESFVGMGWIKTVTRLGT